MGDPRELASRAARTSLGARQQWEIMRDTRQSSIDVANDLWNDVE